MHELFKESNLHHLRSLGYHLTHKAREDGANPGKGMAIAGVATILIGAIMFSKGMSQSQGRGR
ncbi:hypothetical protein [Limnoglobus roseus]|uniref:Uncharacterized protein n=1 Tax=Limnoglobus roseus TaxID=2598579 RepID=A0A5C1ALI2_9BACT|nr:hypothetical protein [Limnoglobus roseus]QEL18602.1 hypothetical protein PX52LOC_05634 [Limnoglobus roseus]